MQEERSDELQRPSAGVQAIGFFSAVDGVIRQANDACLSILGRTRAELDAGALTRALLVPPHMERHVAEALAETERSGGARYEMDFVRPTERASPPWWASHDSSAASSSG